MKEIMKRLIYRLLSKLGYILISKKSLLKYSQHIKLDIPEVNQSTVPYLVSKMNGGLKEKLLKEGKTKWLDIGCGGTFDKNFTYIDLFPESIISEKNKYNRIDIINLTESEAQKLGKFDLVRMQHVFEHFSPEDGLRVLYNCASLLESEGYLLITTPDLKKYINLYLSGTIRNDFDWALKRIRPDSPDSFFFSIYSHSLKFEKHEWCYDAEGLIYQLEQTGKYKSVRELKLGDEMSNIPFTHNRPKEDVCVIGQLKTI